jgi:UDP-glucose 4-epimerase
VPRALVTGGAGFIGSALVPALAGAGYDVLVVDDLSVGDPMRVERAGAELRKGDVRDLELLTTAARGCDVVFHLAAGAGVIESVTDPLTNFDQNALGTLTVLEAARQADVPRLVFSSSNAPLGANAYPAREDKPVAPLSPYGASKAAGEAYCSAYFGAYGMDAVVVRFSNAYGPHSAHKGNVIPLFIRRMRAGEELVVYGDGDQTRDFVFCEDLAAGLIAAARTPAVGGQIFQLASGVETSLNRLLELLSAASGIAPRVRREPPRSGEILRNYSLIDKARSVLGYSPAVPLEDGLKRTWDWFAAVGV